MNTQRIIVLSVLVLIAVILRFMPHPPNFTPVLALALFAGVVFQNRFWALAAPLAVMLVSDLFLGWHNTILYVYVSFTLVVLLGRTLGPRPHAGYIAGSGIAGALLFFLITNFGVWMSGSLYPKTMDGLIAAYVAAIPFFHYMVLSTLFYSGLFFGLFYLACRWLPAAQPPFETGKN